MASDPRALMAKAEKSLQSASGGFSFFGGREEKYQDAAETFQLAANAFRMNKQMVEAGKAFQKAAEVQTKYLNDPDDAANTLIDAAKVYQDADPKLAIECIETAIQRYCAKGNFRRAAGQKENVGKTYEEKLHDLDNAAKSYAMAAEWYEGDNAAALANKNWLKAADLFAAKATAMVVDPNDEEASKAERIGYEQAIKLYEKVAQASINSNLMVYSVKDYLLKAGLCYLAYDSVGAELAVGRYSELLPSFSREREGMVLKDLVDAVKEGNPDNYADKLFKYDAVSRLDKWKTDICLKIKNKIDSTDEFA